MGHVLSRKLSWVICSALSCLLRVDALTPRRPASPCLAHHTPVVPSRYLTQQYQFPRQLRKMEVLLLLKTLTRTMSRTRKTPISLTLYRQLEAT